MNTYASYQLLRKPRWSPPGSVFGPVWTALYILITISFGAALLLATQGTIAPVVLLPFALNLIFNLAFTPIQFGLKNLPLASIDILLVLITLVWAMTAIYPFAPWIAWIQIPYLLWVSFATVLQLTITGMNS